VNVRPELELLLCCVQATPSAVTRARIQTLLRAELDWVYLRQLARNHGVMPLLYHSLSHDYPQAVPAAVLQQLESDFYGNAARNLRLVGKLLGSLDFLADRGIAAIPYKGPVLAASAYGDLAVRQFDDLDILVHERDATRARDLLVAEGLRCEPNVKRAQEAAYLRDYGEYQLVGGDGQLILELHWRLAESYFSVPLATAQLWERLQPVLLVDRELRTLSPEDLLLILCLHGGKHFWSRLAWVCDVARLIAANPALNWMWVMEQATGARCARMLWLGLVLACDLLDTPVPEAVQQRARADEVAASLAAQVRDWLARDTRPDPIGWSALLFHLKARERWQDRVRYSVRLLLTPTPGDWAFVQLPPALSPLYYLLRPFRLIGHYVLQNLRATH
jgi:hypothetical protein